MYTFHNSIQGIDSTEAKFDGYVIENSEEIVPQRRRPAVLIIPGGGYEMTSDREAEPIAMQFIAHGIHAFILRYSVAPSRYPVALLEAAQAVQTIREHADEWHVNPDAILVIGFSAGGHLAANLATSSSDSTLEQHGYELSKVKPNGLILAYPVITSGPYAHRGSFDALLGDLAQDEHALESVSVERFVDSNTPPTFLWHTMPDDCVPVENSLLFLQAAHQAGVPVEAHFFPTGGHGLALGTKETAWQGTNGIEPAVQSWIDLCFAWVDRNFTVLDDSRA